MEEAKIVNLGVKDFKDLDGAPGISVFEVYVTLLQLESGETQDVKLSDYIKNISKVGQ